MLCRFDFVLFLKSPSKCFRRTCFSPRVAHGVFVTNIHYSGCDTRSIGCPISVAVAYLYLWSKKLILAAALWIGDLLPPSSPQQTEVNRARPSAPSHTCSLQSDWSCCISAKHHDVRAITFSGKIVIFLIQVGYQRVFHYQARKWSAHADTLSWIHLTHLRRDGLSSGQTAVSINYRWSIKGPSNSLTCLHVCCGGKGLKPDCAEVSVSDQKSYILQTIFFYFLLKLISDYFQKANDSNVTFLCELSYVPASPEQAFSEKVTNTDIIKSPDYFQLFPLTSGRCGAQCFTAAVCFTAMV